MVERNGADVVVQDVCFNDAVEQLAANEAEFAINRCCGSTGVGPGFGVVMWQSRIGVLKVSDGNCTTLVWKQWHRMKTEYSHMARNYDAEKRGELTQPVIDPHVRQEVPHEHVLPAIGRAEIVQDRPGNAKPDIAEQD